MKTLRRDIRRCSIEVLFVLIVCSSLVYAIEADFACPSEVSVDEEFECSLTARDFEGAWDVKVELMDGNVRLAEIFDEDLEAWKSAYYYLYGVIEEVDKEYIIQLRVIKDFSGDVVGVLKLRKGGSTEFFEFDINIGEGSEGSPEVVEETEEEVAEVGIAVNEEEGDVVLNSDVIKKEEVKPVSVINLNSVAEVGDGGGEGEGEVGGGEVVYESKNEKIRKYEIYGFALFLIFVLGVVLWRG